MRIVFLILVLGLIGTVYACGPWKLVYTNGYALAVQQDSLIRELRIGRDLDRRTIRELRINWWVKTAYRTAPGNLPVRQYCIIDIARNKPRHRRRIRKMVDTLSSITKMSSYRTWAEGYSYWKYTYDALGIWIEKFKDEELKLMADKIDSGFAYTAYRRVEGLYYPAPFGDLRDEPLNDKGQEIALQITNVDHEARCQNVLRNVSGTSWKDTKIRYQISAMPVGLNNHCEKQSREYEVVDGVVMGFKYYEGYDKKYKDKEAEWTDILDIRRLITLPFIW